MSLRAAETLLVYSGQRLIRDQEFLASIGFNSDILQLADRGKFPIGFGITFTFEDAEIEHDGLPTDEARDNAFDRRDAIVEMCGDHGLGGICVGDIFWNARVRHQLQLSARDGLAKTQKAITTKFGAATFDVEPGWAFSDAVLKPTLIEREYAENRDTLLRLEEHGVEATEHEVDFQFVGAKRNLLRLSARLSERGFATKFFEKDLIATRTVSLEWWAFAKVCSELRKDATDLTVEFDGWGCMTND